MTNISNTRETGTGLYTQHGGSPPPRGGVPIWAIVVAIFIVGNLLAAGLYLSRRTARSAVENQTAMLQPRPAASPAKEPQKNDGIWRAKRVAGLASLESGDYARAIELFTEAMRAAPPDEQTDLPDLLKIARELADSQKAREQKEKEKEQEEAKDDEKIDEDEPEPSRPSTRRARRHSRPAPKPRPAPAPTPEPKEPEPPAPGLLLVTSQPSGLLVIVDGEKKDLTPARVQVIPGEHKVELKKGTRVVMSTRVTVASGAVATVDADVPEDEPKPAPKEEAQVAVAEPPAPVKPAEPPVAKPAPAPKPTPDEPAASGSLEILSPNLHAEVWVDGKKQVGFPPLRVNDVAVGYRRVELRVDGNVVKSKIVRVKRVKLQTVRF